MCNLYRMTKSDGEVAKWFDAVNKASGSNTAEHIWPGYPGLVVAAGELRPMSWGFPLVMKSKRTGEPLKPKPVNNARTDKLDGFFWKSSFEKRRCLIPLSAWAEAEGPKGAKTRTWLSLADVDLFAVAGVYRDSDEFGPCYSMVMTSAAGAAAEVHDRMPVILRSDDYASWQSGDPSEAKELCRPYEGNIFLARTSDSWT
ncbi:MAG: SOS response-associated peptidase family protein [Pseudomonadota bacterium]